MRSIWINEGDELVPARLAPHGIDRVFFSERTHTRAHLAKARQAGYLVGVYSNPQWYGFEDPKAYRTRVSQRLTALGVDDEQCDVQFNVEKVALLQAGVRTPEAQNQYVIDLFYWWRRSRALRQTSWTLEGMQGGWFYPAFRHPNLVATTLVPQAYDGAMVPWDPAGVVKDLLDWGATLPVVPFVDAAALLPHWYGFAYMQHRLPA